MRRFFAVTGERFRLTTVWRSVITAISTGVTARRGDEMNYRKHENTIVWSILFAWVVGLLLCAAFWVGVGYVVIHFIHKHW